ncbi:MAG: PEP-CTERM sorting domain-containing protein [Phycisphaeraceae bacterium]|nr:PEP-CTERM sorting domain-containing protein [Phycisphaeraceae bacterium]
MKHQWFAGLVVVALFCSLSPQVLALVGDDLVAHWKLDETSGTTANDSAPGNLYSGTLNGLAGGPVINQAGMIGNAYDFEDTNDDYVSIGSAPDIGTAHTFTGWVMPESTHSGVNAASRNTVFGQTSIQLLVAISGTSSGAPADQPDILDVYYNSIDDGGGNPTLKTTSGIIAPGSWYHLAYARNGASVNLYINGILQTPITGVPVTGQVNAMSDMLIGRYSTQTSRDFDGLLDDLGLWNAEKSGEEIALIHGLGRFLGVGLNVYSIDNVKAVFDAASGSAGAGGYQWSYVTGLASSTAGEIGGTVGGGDAWIALDASGNGVQIGAALHDGDANGDGQVNLSDLQILGDNWQAAGASWDLADFSGDGVVNLSDLQILGDNWGFGVGPDLSFDEALALVGVPEPTSLVLLGLGGLLLARRQK